MIEKHVVADRFTRTLQNVMYRITKECSVFYDLINIILLAKFFIHKCLYFKSTPLFIVFKMILNTFQMPLVNFFNLFVLNDLL